MHDAEIQVRHILRISQVLTGRCCQEHRLSVIFRETGANRTSFIRLLFGANIIGYRAKDETLRTTHG